MGSLQKVHGISAKLSENLSAFTPARAGGRGGGGRVFLEGVGGGGLWGGTPPRRP